MKNNTQYEIHTGSLYRYSASCYTGVLMKENVMRKLVKLQAKHLENVKRLLANEAEKGNVFSYGWTLHYPNSEQTPVFYIDKSSDVMDSIRFATISTQPVHEPLVFKANSMEEAESMADARWEALNNDTAN